jgi:branched-chain amino acid transport system ATP-binding protein
VIIVEHHMDVVMSICDRISVLNFGELIASGTKDEVRNNPDVIAAYLGSHKAGAK